MDEGGGGCRKNCVENSHPPSWFAEGQEVSVRRQSYQALIQHGKGTIFQERGMARGDLSSDGGVK